MPENDTEHDLVAKGITSATVLMVGDVVSLVIGTQFLPNKTGEPIRLIDRQNGTLTHWDEYENAFVEWPNGESYSYEPALLTKVATQ